MPRFRRYRVFLFVALCTIAALYHFTTVREWEDATAASVQSLKKITYQDGGSPAAAGQDGKQTDGSPNGPPITNTASPDQNPALQPSFSSTTVPKEQEIAPSSLISPSQQDEKATTASAANLDADFLKKDTTVKQVGQGRKELTVPIPDKPPIHWKKTPDHFPIPPEKLIRLPTEKPLDIPKIQAVFKDESPVQKKAREVKLAKIKEAFQFSWDGYKTHAWMHDELTPTTGSYKDPFNGWAATLVDSLDTLWIMGMEDEFRQAMLAIREIDFTTSLRHDIPVFETTIRYLGGLLSAYDLTGGKQDILLRLAKELGDVLMGAFDTPNRMPLTYYYWMPTFASNSHRASNRVVLAELGSLAMEFTRLAQLTEDPRYYDAIARITNELDEWQNQTKIPGLWPKTVDASGCRKPAYSNTQQAQHSLSNGPGTDFAARSDKNTDRQSANETVLSLNEQNEHRAGLKRRQLSQKLTDTAAPQLANAPGHQGSSGSGTVANAMSALTSPAAEKTAFPECEPQGLGSPLFSSSEDFGLGGMADSTYEYLPKQHVLLGGLVPQYKKMYEAAIKAANKYLLFRPMLPDNPDIYILGSAMAREQPDEPGNLVLSAEQTHLMCFAGGMYGIGAKIFERKDDLEIAEKLTNGCVWSYEAMQTGIMPERFMTIPCKSLDGCAWNETYWKEVLDPYREAREQQQALWKAAAEAEGAEAAAQPKAPAAPESADGPSLAKRQLGDIENDRAIAATEYGESIKAGEKRKSILESTPSLTSSYPSYPDHESFVNTKIQANNLPIGIPEIADRRYILRPEAIESVFIMYRITGDESWRDKGWRMFQAIESHTKARYGYSSISDVTSKVVTHTDGMESFWLSETLKYFYLLFSSPDTISLDDYVLNTEAHPFRRRN